MKTKIIAGSLLVVVALSGCESPKETVGTLGGGALGAWAGSGIGSGRGRLVATAIGAVGGAFLGGQIGRHLDSQDKKLADHVSQTALESGRSGRGSTWTNPDSGHSGTFIPAKAYQNNNGLYCREFTHRVSIGGKTEEAYGTACRQPDGAWKLIQ